jgi:metallo-beta-lactamase family protein
MWHLLPVPARRGIIGRMTTQPSPESGPTVTFWGAAHTVTGSMHILEASGRRFLLDCGLFQGRRDEARRRNSHFPVRPAEIEAVVLSHAHIDHSGNLPNLVKQGFHGPIYCTPATRDLLAVMLADSAKIQEEDAAYLNRKRGHGEPLVQPLYDRGDAHRTLRHAQPLRYDQPFDLGHGLQLHFVDAGHLLGSAMVHLKIDAGGREHTLTFTGDVGRRGEPILRDPSPVPPAGLIISESTYGGRTHPPTADLPNELAAVVRRTADRGGKVIVPAFSLGRTQTVVYFLHQLIRDGRLTELPIFVDSPLSTEATAVFRLHPECFDEETALLLEEDPDLFGGRRIRYVQSVEESKSLNDRRDPCIIIASSGMCESGRVLHHLRHNVEDPRNTVLIIGFQAPDTLGRRLVERQPKVRILDHWLQLNAEVVVLNGFSSHADRNDLLALLGPLAGQTAKVRLVHGDPDQSEALAQALRDKGFADVTVPQPGDAVPLP